MKRRYRILFFSFLLSTLFLQCKKDKLPKATEKGANTFGCKINGVSFEPCPKLYVPDPSLYVSLSVGTTTSVIIGADCTQGDPYKYVIITLGNFHGIGEYLLSDNENNICQYREPDPYPGNYFSSYYTHIGKVTITKDDRTNYILSGTFEFTAANQDNSSNVVMVTEGRFDVSYK